MDFERVKTRIKCDASGCANLSDYRLINKRFVFNGNFYLCKTCLNELYRLISNHVVPKSPEPIFKKKGVKNDTTI